MRRTIDPPLWKASGLILALAIMAVAVGCSGTTGSTAAPVATASRSEAAAAATPTEATPAATPTEATPAASPSAAAPAASGDTAMPATSGEAGMASSVPMCSPDGAASTDTVASWAGPVGGTPSIIPILVSTQSTVGPNRFLYSIANSSNVPIAAPDVATRVRFYALERDPETPTAEVEGIFLDTGLGHGLYRTAVEFDCAGEWGAEVEADLGDGQVATKRLRFTVLPEGTTPGIGEPAPRSETPTAATPEEVATISTDDDPFPGAYARTVAEVVTSGEPSIVFFATPAFCQTGICGPTMEVVKSVAADYVGRVAFVNVEPYELHMTENGLQPALDANGNLQPVQAVIDYGLRTEPFLFVVDADGDVFATFEAVVGEDELRAALDEVLAETA